MNEIICQICGYESKSFQSLSLHITNKHKEITKKEYYDKFLIKNEKEKICKFCGKDSLFQDIKGYLNHCGCRNKNKVKSICQICKKEFKITSTLSRHILKNHKDFTLQKYFDSFLLKNQDNTICIFCGDKTNFLNLAYGYHYSCTKKECILKNKEKTSIKNWGTKSPFQSTEIKLKISKTIREKYGVNHHLQKLEIYEKQKQTNLKKYGFEYVLQSPEIKEKSKKTMIISLGVDNCSKSQTIKDKKIRTCLKNYNCEHPLNSQIIKNKMKQTNILKYGVENVFQSEVIKEKIKKVCLLKYGFKYALQSPLFQEKFKQTCLTRFGYKHPMQNSFIFNKAMKNSFKTKDYVLPSGKIIKVQGYENYVLDELFELGYLEEDLIIQQRQEMPEIWYKTADGKKHRYYPDIFIPKDNLVIEVKSTWTFEQIGNSLETNIFKAQACLDAGYKFIFKIIEF